MRILYVNHAISDFGGIERYINETTKRLIAKGHAVEFLTMRYETAVEGAVAHIVFGKNLPKPLSHLLFAMINPWRISRLRKTRNIDVVVSNNSASLTSDLVVANSVHEIAIHKLNQYSAIEETRLRYIVTRFLRAIRPQNLVTIFIERWAYKRGAHKVIAVSEGIKRELMEYYHLPAKRIEIIPNGANIERFIRNDIVREKARAELGVQPSTIVLLFVAHEFKRKGLRFILDALAQMPERDCALLIIGKDDPKHYKEIAQKYGIDSKTHFMGLITTDIERWYAASDIFVFPTAYEAFSLATLEAGAAHLPLIVTRINGTDELVKEGENGYFVQRDGKDIARAIARIADDPKLISVMGAASRRIAEQYSWDVLADRTENAMLSAI